MINKLKECYRGFQSTPLLWKNDDVYRLYQFPIHPSTRLYIPNPEHKNLRLGKWVEKFVSFQLQQLPNIKILAEGLQIKDNKHTIGELDLLFIKNEQPIHLEIVYKFYLYDTKETYNNCLEHWIGPNRKDSLLYKLKKLKEKQLPILYSKNAEEALDNYGFDVTSVKQHVCFKAQLFLPYKMKAINNSPLNNDCVVGHYISYSNIIFLKNCEFHIPNKLDWLIIPNQNVPWLDFDEGLMQIKKQINDERSPLVWIKNTAGIKKCFVTWW